MLTTATTAEELAYLRELSSDLGLLLLLLLLFSSIIYPIFFKKFVNPIP